MGGKADAKEEAKSQLRWAVNGAVLKIYFNLYYFEASENLGCSVWSDTISRSSDIFGSTKLRPLPLTAFSKSLA